ncbi:MAG: hypothetical protein C6P35_00235 [Cohnella sp.]|uniref:YycH family regulatory protein n=1 Tax=Cohnella sp. TaxID=1883426 RepID=UPI000E3A6FC7|nr:two-component system activity regulator YycH [Cohnella sp.]REK68756.1 MAG: hypothetical protein C6P35_00235 [Cohnella sp.]
MIENAKTALLAFLVVLSLVQSYFLMYSTPGMETKIGTEQDYVKMEPLGPEEKVENLLFPEQLVLHMGEDRHTVFYPQDTFYQIVLTKLQSREFKGFQRDAVQTTDWDLVRKEDLGVEVRFGRPVPFELLQRVFKIDGDFLFSGDSITRIWIFARKDRDEVRTFFFSSDGRSVYESQRADLTVQDVQQYTGFGQYWTPFQYWNGIYMPVQAKSYPVLKAAYSRFTPDQMQRNLFLDPTTTRTIQDRQDGTQIYTDGKRGLKVEQAGGWLTYTDPVAPTDSENNLTDNIASAVQFVNQHGGWNGMHRLVRTEATAGANAVWFQQYYNGLPIQSDERFRFGYMQLSIQQGVVSSYERSLITLDMEPTKTGQRKLPAADALKRLIRETASGGVVETIYPAYRPKLEDKSVLMTPVWAIRLTTGEVRTFG